MSSKYFTSLTETCHWGCWVTGTGAEGRGTHTLTPAAWRSSPHAPPPTLANALTATLQPALGLSSPSTQRLPRPEWAQQPTLPSAVSKLCSPKGSDASWAQKKARNPVSSLSCLLMRPWGLSTLASSQSHKEEQNAQQTHHWANRPFQASGSPSVK